MAGQLATYRIMEHHRYFPTCERTEVTDHFNSLIWLWNVDPQCQDRESYNGIHNVMPQKAVGGHRITNEVVKQDET